jgi:hypothetical protein
LQVREAADVGGGDALGSPGRPAGGERVELPLTQLPGKHRLQDRVGARRAAAQVAVGDRCQLTAGRTEQRFDLSAQLLAMLQRTGRLEGDA